MPKIVNTALKAKAWTFEAKAKAKTTGPEAKAKAKAIKFGLEAPRGQGLASRTTTLLSVTEGPADGGRAGWRAVFVVDGRAMSATTITRNCVHRFSPNLVRR